MLIIRFVPPLKSSFNLEIFLVVIHLTSFTNAVVNCQLSVAFASLSCIAIGMLQDHVVIFPTHGRRRGRRLTHATLIWTSKKTLKNRIPPKRP